MKNKKILLASLPSTNKLGKIRQLQALLYASLTVNILFTILIIIMLVRRA